MLTLGPNFVCVLVLVCGRYVASVDREGVAKLSLIDVALDHAYATPSGACYCFRIFSEMHDREAITIQGAIGMPRATVRARRNEGRGGGGLCVCTCVQARADMMPFPDLSLCLI